MTRTLAAALTALLLALAATGGELPRRVRREDELETTTMEIDHA